MRKAKYKIISVTPRSKVVRIFSDQVRDVGTAGGHAPTLIQHLSYSVVPKSLKPYPTDRDYCRFLSVLLVHQIIDIGNEMGA